MKKLSILFLVLIYSNYNSYGQTRLTFTPVSTWAYGSCNTVSVSQVNTHTFYVGEGGTFIILDISNHDTPIKVGEFTTPGVISKIAVSKYAYLADNNGGLRIIDLTTPNSPKEKGAFPGFVTTLAVSGNYCYIVDGSVLKILDISNPAVPMELSTCYPSGTIFDIAVYGKYVYAVGALGLFTAGINVFDVSDPSHPINISFTSYVGSGGTPQGIAIYGSYAYIVGSNGLSIIDISIPTNPVLKGSVGLPGCGNKIQIAGGGAYAFIVDDKGYSIVNIYDPSAPKLVGNAELSIPPTGIATFGLGHETVISNGGHGIRIFDNTDLVNPVEVGTFDIPGSPNQIIVKDKYAYIAADAGGLRILDISIPYTPSEVGYLNLPGKALDVSVLGNYAYIAADDKGLRIVDISKPAQPKEVGFYLTPSSANGLVALGDGYVMLTSGNSGLFIIDATDPTNPKKIINISTQGNAQKVSWFGGKYAFVANKNGGLFRIDVSDFTNPNSPYLLNSDLSYYSVLTTPAYGTYAFAAGGPKGLRVIDGSNLYFTKDIGGIQSQFAVQLAIDEQYLYFVDANDGLHVADISDPQNIENIGSYVIKNNAKGIAVANGTLFPGKYIYITSNDYGIYILKQNSPNSNGWINQFSGVSSLLKSVKAIDKDVAWAAGYSGKVVMTKDGGENWNLVSNYMIGSDNIYNIEAIDINTAFITSTSSSGKCMIQKMGLQ